MKEEIKQFFKGNVLDDEEIIKEHSRDASIFEVKPKLVVFPKDSEDVQSLIKYVNEKRKIDPTLSITARSAGTDMSGGPLNESIILDFIKYMNKSLGFKETKEGGEVKVQPGMYYRDFEKETLKYNLLMPSYPASKSICAVGGMVANNAAGEKTLRVGRTADYIKELKVVFADGNEYIVRPLLKGELEKKITQNDFEGNIYKKIYQLITDNFQLIIDAKPNVSKNVAGYAIWDVLRSDANPQMHANLQRKKEEEVFDLTKLIIGSQGTLGIVTEITFRLVPVKKISKLFVIFLPNLEPLGELTNQILSFNPESLEAYDDKTLKLAVRFFPDFLKNKGLWGMIKFMVSLLPELRMMLTGGFPKLVLLAEFAGENEGEIDRKMKELEKKIKPLGLKTHITRSEEEANKYWDIRRESFNLLRKHIKGKRTAPFIDDIIVRPEFIPEFLPKLNKILDVYKKYMEYTIAGHAGSGNFHIIPLMDFTDPKSQEIILEVSDKVYDLVLSYGGSITAEHNDGIIRTPYLEKMYGREVYGIFKKIKNIFDPQNIFNPGKKVGGSKEYIKEHLIRNS